MNVVYMNKKEKKNIKNSENVEGDAQLDMSIFRQGVREEKNECGEFLVSSDLSLWIDENDENFLREFYRKFGSAVEVTNKPFGDYAFTLVGENGGLIDVFFANELTYVSLVVEVRSRIYVEYDEKIMEKILRGNRDSDEVLVIVQDGNTSKLEFLSYRQIVSRVYGYGYELKRIENMLVLRGE